eukprot:jgi/Ulvmu1/2442/UM135_0002.1
MASSVDGGQVSLTTTGNAMGFATVTIDGRPKTIGATSIDGDSNATMLEFMASLEPPVVVEAVADPTEGVPAPPVVSATEAGGPPSPAATAGDEGAARLVSRVDVNGYATGALQVFCEGAWGAVCNSNFDNRDALVACRQLGFSSGLIQPSPQGFQFGNPDPAIVAPFALENLGCAGNESRLVDCPVEAFDDTYSSYEYFRFQDYNDENCDPFRGTFARIACGTSGSA